MWYDIIVKAWISSACWYHVIFVAPLGHSNIKQIFLSSNVFVTVTPQHQSLMGLALIRIARVGGGGGGVAHHLVSSLLAF